MTDVAVENDLHAEMCATWRPTDEQVEIAQRMINGNVEASVLVGLALPGKRDGWWKAGQTCEPAPGYFYTPDLGAGYSAARIAADAAAGRTLGEREGVASYCVIDSDGWAVFEGITGDPDYRHLREEW